MIESKVENNCSSIGCWNRIQFKIHPQKILDKGTGIREIKEKALPLTSMGYGKALRMEDSFSVHNT